MIQYFISCYTNHKADTINSWCPLVMYRFWSKSVNRQCTDLIMWNEPTMCYHMLRCYGYISKWSIYSVIVTDS